MRAALGPSAVGFEYWRVDRSLVGLLEEALAGLGDDDSALRARLLTRLASALYYSGATGRCTALSSEAVAMARRIGDPAALASVLIPWGLAVQVRLHEAAGARAIYSTAAGLPRWQRGEDLDGFIQQVQQVPFVPVAAGGQVLFSAHQLGSCRMGKDRSTSVANPWGELHDVRGVWIGDASAFPTATGTNPMVTIMALARRTAEAIAASVGAGAQARAASRA